MTWYLATDEGQYLTSVIADIPRIQFTEHVVKFDSQEEAQAFLDSEPDLPPGLKVTDVERLKPIYVKRYPKPIYGEKDWISE